MSIAVRCAKCNQGFSTPDALGGKRVKCPKCAAAVTVPGGEPPAAQDPWGDLLPERASPTVQFPTAEAAAGVTLPAATSPPQSRPRKSKKARPANSEDQRALQGKLGGLVALTLGGGTLCRLDINVLSYVGIALAVVGLVSFVVLCVVARKNLTIRHLPVIVVAVILACGVASYFHQMGEEDRIVEEAGSDLNSAYDEMVSAMSHIHDLDSARQYAPQLRAGDLRGKTWDIRWQGKKLHKSRSQSLKDSFAPSIARLKSECQACVTRLANNPAALQVVWQSTPYLLDEGHFAGADPARVNAILNAEFDPPQTGEIAATGPSSPQLPHTESAKPGGDGSAASESNSSAVALPIAKSTPKQSTDDADLLWRLRQDPDFVFTRSGQFAGRCRQLAAMLCDDDQLSSALRYCPALRLPSVCVHFGFGVISANAPSSKPKSSDASNLSARPAPNHQPKTREQSTIAALQNELVGEIGSTLVSKLQSRINTRAYGNWGETFFTQTELRGITRVEAASRKAAISTAAELAIDVLVLIELVRQQPRQNNSPVEMQISLIHPATAKLLWQSTTITDRARAAAIRKGKEDPAAALIDGALLYADENLQLRKLPALKPAAARKRAEKLVGDLSVDLFSALVELRYYQSQGLLPSDEARRLYATLLSADMAEPLVSNDLLQRARVYEKLLVK